MKILLLGFAKLKFMPYAKFYLEQIDRQRHEVHLAYWNRDLKDEDASAFMDIQLHEFRCLQSDAVPKRAKLSSFWAYRKFVKSVLNAEEFGFIISLHTLPGLTVLDKLLHKYRGRYILDYRDSTLEEHWWFKSLVGKMATGAKVTFVSSDAFRKYLPTDRDVRIITSHNLLVDTLNHRDYEKVPSNKIRIAFWGLLRHANLNKLIIDRLGGDPRFELHYYGRELTMGEILRTHCRQVGADNVFFHGEYSPEDRYEFAKNTDMIHNIYLDINTLFAMGNKYYDGIIFRIPQICMTGSFMAEMCEKNGIGMAADPRDGDFADKIFEYYTNLHRESFNIQCDKELERVLGEYNEGQSLLKTIFNP